MILSYDVASGSELTLCNKIDSSGLQIYEKRYDVHINVAYIMTKLYRFYARKEISKYSKCHMIIESNPTFMCLFY